MTTKISLISREFDGNLIQQREADGYINATAMCKACGKLFADYNRLSGTQNFLRELSLDIGTPISKLVIIRRGKPAHLQGTWIHPKLSENLNLWLKTSPPRTLNELTIQKQLCHELDGRMEVSVPPGKIDILTDAELIEVKPVRNWMKGVGQVMIYGQHFPNHQKRIHLFGRVRNSTKKMIESHCNQLKIKVTWHDSEKNVIDTA